MNDQIVNAVAFMTNVALYDLSKEKSKEFLSPLCTHIALHSFAFDERFLEHSSQRYNKYVKMLQDPSRNSDSLKLGNWYTDTQWENAIQVWYATHNFGQLAR